MQPRQPLPRLWMMTDERQGKALWAALVRLPGGAGIVFRHYSLAREERRRLFEAVQAVAADKRHVLLLAGPVQLALDWGADGSHGWEGAAEPGLLRSVSVHGATEMEAANRLEADLAFVSPVFPTRSHPGARTLGPDGLLRLAAQARMPVIALGGMNEERAGELTDCAIHGWAAIDAWTGA